MEHRNQSGENGQLFSRIAPEAGLLLGAGRAILLQLAHPQIGRAIAEHSGFAANPLSRLVHTLGYIYALSNGTQHSSEPSSITSTRRIGPCAERARTACPPIQRWIPSCNCG
nr:oxygenase MpaB family protein [Glutamicibacter nicotianae]